MQLASSYNTNPTIRVWTVPIISINKCLKNIINYICENKVRILDGLLYTMQAPVSNT